MALCVTDMAIGSIGASHSKTTLACVTSWRNNEHASVTMNIAVKPGHFVGAIGADRLPLTAREYLRGKRVLVTGVCGTVGRQLAQSLVETFEVGSLVGLDHNESELALLEEVHRSHPNVRLLLADMRDPAAVLRESRRIDVLFHTAAYQHV